MSGPKVPEGSEFLIHADNVIATQTDGRVQIMIADPTSTEQVLAVAGALWEVWTSVRDRVVGNGLQCELHVRQLDEVPMALANVFSLIDQDLGQTGRPLLILDSPAADVQEEECA